MLEEGFLRTSIRKSHETAHSPKPKVKSVLQQTVMKEVVEVIENQPEKIAVEKDRFLHPGWRKDLKSKVRNANMFYNS